ncbi:MAG TPA: HAD family phosphatase [Steroidobacteraceae bacterium]|nr:HAD family phosphatase [Steroidobacteraceae bacterium]
MERFIPHAVVFDCDGTLVDSELIHARALQGALAGLGITLSPEQILSQCAGVANADFLRRVAQEHELAFPGDIDKVVEDNALRIICEELRAIEGAGHVVNVLAARGVRLAVASNSTRRLVRQMLSTAGLSPVFGERIATCEDVTAPKPAPDVYRLALSMLAARPEDSLAVEDSPVGVTAAHRAGMTVVGFCPPSGTFGEGELIRAGAFTAIPDLGELLRWPLRGPGRG